MCKSKYIPLVCGYREDIVDSQEKKRVVLSWKSWYLGINLVGVDIFISF